MLRQFMRRASTFRGPIGRALLSNDTQTRSFSSVTPLFHHQRNVNPLRNFHTQVQNSDYLRLPGFEHCVPSENIIDNKLADLLANTSFANLIEFQRYQGQQLSQPQITEHNQLRDYHYQQVHRFHMFHCNPVLPDMEHGVLIKREPDRVSRCHMLVDKESGKILGAIYFTINLEVRVAFFHLVQVDNELLQKGMGKLLMHSAIYVCLLYHCSSISLISIKRMIGFYEHMGFIKNQEVPNRDRYELDLINGPMEQVALFLRSFTNTAPQVNIEELIEELKQLHPTNPHLVPTPQAIFDFVQQKKDINHLISRCKP